VFTCVVTETVNGTTQYQTARAIIITFVFNDHIDEEAVEAWEKA